MVRHIKGETREQLDARIEAEAVHWPLPLGENPGDLRYGKAQLNPLDPSDHAVIVGKLDPAALITDASERVLHCADEMLRWHADQIAKAVAAGADQATVGMTPSTWTFVKRSRDRFAQLLAMLKDPDLSEKDRREATDEAIWLAFMIGETKGQLGQTLHGRADRKRAQAELMRDAKDRIRLARLASEREIIKETGWRLDGDGLARRLAERLGPQEDTGKLVPPSTMRRDIKDLQAESRGA